MIKTYQIILDKKRAKIFRRHLNNMGVKHIASEVGEQICFQFDYKDNEMSDIRILLDKTNAETWTEDLYKYTNYGGIAENGKH